MNVNGFNSIEQVTGNYLKQKATNNTQPQGMTFVQALQSAIGSEDGVKFSKHASERLLNRNISLTDSQMQRLNEGTKVASEKGIKESLVLLDDLAFIVNTKNNTVITAMNNSSSEENVYTNIDGAVVI